MSEFYLLVILALAIRSFKTAYGQPPTHIGTPCQRRCNIAFSCLPFFKQPIYSVVNGQCRIWQNSCFFSSENCSRRRQCQEELIETTKEVCVKNCPQFCPDIYEPICATFATTNQYGENILRTESFGNICDLNRYVCSNGEPYVNEPTKGECEKN